MRRSLLFILVALPCIALAHPPPKEKTKRAKLANTLLLAREQ